MFSFTATATTSKHLDALILEAAKERGLLDTDKQLEFDFKTKVTQGSVESVQVAALAPKTTETTEKRGRGRPRKETFTTTATETTESTVSTEKVTEKTPNELRLEAVTTLKKVMETPNLGGPAVREMLKMFGAANVSSVDDSVLQALIDMARERLG